MSCLVEPDNTSARSLNAVQELMEARNVRCRYLLSILHLGKQGQNLLTLHESSVCLLHGDVATDPIL